MAETDVAFVVQFVHREVNNPAETECVLFKKVEANTQFGAEIAGLLPCVLFFCDKCDKCSCLDVKSFNESIFAVYCKLGDSPLEFALFVQFEPVHTACAVKLDLFCQCINELPANVCAVDCHCLDGLALFKERCFFFKNIGDVLDDEGVSKVGFV